MEPDSEFDLMNYSELRFQAKQFGVKANLKTDKLRKELKRVSMLGGVDDEFCDPLSAPVSLPIKTPGHVTRRKHSRLPPQPRTSNLPVDAPVSCVDKSAALPKVAPESPVAAGVGIGDKTMADPLGEAKDLEDLRPYLSDDEDVGSNGAKLSAFLSEGEEELDKDINSDKGSKTTDAVDVKEAPSEHLKLERQKTFEIESPANVLTPLARERTFEMESPTIDSPRPPLARSRTFENESPADVSTDRSTRRRTFEKEPPPIGPSRSSSRRRTFEKDPVDSAPGSSLVRENTFEKKQSGSKSNFEEAKSGFENENAVSTIFGMEIPDSPEAPLPTAEFSILQDETSGLSDEELKARIMASIAVTPCSGLAVAGASTKKGNAEDGNEGKSVSKDWKKIHSTNEKGMESLVDFYQRKRKRAEEAGKSTQKSAAKVAGVAAATKDQTTGKSVRALAFPKDRPTVSRARTPTTKSAIPTLAKVLERNAPQIQGKAATAVSKNAGSAAKRARVELLAAQSLKRARTAIASPAAANANKRLAPKVPNEPSSKRMKTTTKGVPVTSRPVKSAATRSFVPTVFSTKNISLNFGAVETKSRDPVVQPVVKIAGAVSTTGAGAAGGSKAKIMTSVTKTKVPASVLPSLPKLGGDRRVSPRVNKTANTANVAAPGNSTVKSSSTFSTPNAAAITKTTTPLSRLAPSRNTTPGKRSVSGTPASASRLRKTPQSQQKSPWIPAGFAMPKFNFAGTSAEDTENVFKFTAPASQQKQQQQTGMKKFDLKESLKQKLKYKPHRGPLRAYEDGKAKASAMNKKQFRR